MVPGLVLPESELSFESARSGGPGGQNVNKVATKVILRFRPADSRVLDEDQKRRILGRLEHRMTLSGELVLHSSRHRQRSRNLEEARSRLAELLAEALRHRRPRRPTRPTRASGRRRIESKRRRGDEKRRRRPSTGWD